MPYTLEEVYEAVSRPRDFFTMLPIPLEFKSFRGSDVIVYMNAFGYRGEAVFSFVVTRGTNRFALESGMIGELVLGFFRPPPMDLTFRMSATKLEGGTEISFELYVRLSPIRERLSGISSETERFISRIPDRITETLRRVSVKPAEVRREIAELPKPTVALPARAEERVAETSEIKMTSAVPMPGPPGEEISKAADRATLDVYSSLLEDPIAVYKLTTQGRSITTFRARYSPSLIKTLSDISSKNNSPIYAILRGEKQTVRIIIEYANIVGALLEEGSQLFKGERALELLKESKDEFVCAVFAVGKDVLESLKR